MARRRRRRPAKKHLVLLNLARKHYERILEGQGGGCAMCGRPPTEKRRLDIDHDHKTMRIRGLLCPRCNIFLGASRDPELHREAARYLEQGPIEWLEEAMAESVRNIR
jgi:hypothetical protein